MYGRRDERERGEGLLDRRVDRRDEGCSRRIASRIEVGAGDDGIMQVKGCEDVTTKCKSAVVRNLFQRADGREKSICVQNFSECWIIVVVKCWRFVPFAPEVCAARAGGL